MKCGDCKWDYPDDYLHPMFSNISGTAGYTPPLCGICALKRMNDNTSVKRKEFSGVIAEFWRKKALRWREKHPKISKSEIEG